MFLDVGIALVTDDETVVHFGVAALCSGVDVVVTLIDADVIVVIVFVEACYFLALCYYIPRSWIPNVKPNRYFKFTQQLC